MQCNKIHSVEGSLKQSDDEREDLCDYQNRSWQSEHALPSSPILAFDLMPSKGDLSRSESFNLSCSRETDEAEEVIK